MNNMNTPNKIRVAVLYGGRSGEHEVSLVSATQVIQHLDRSLFDVIPIGIDKNGTWFLGDDILKKELTSPNIIQLNRDANRMLFDPALISSPIRSTALKALDLTKLALASSDRLFDVVFPVMHGTFCEDGAVQGLLELAGLPYVGCGILASAIGMDKDFAKRLVSQAGLLVTPFIAVKKAEWNHLADNIHQRVMAELNYPVFVKPANGGSSVGMHKVKSPNDLSYAVNDAFQYDVKILIEKALDVREIEVAVLESEREGDAPIVSIPGEIKPAQKHEFYSYTAKYIDENGADLVIPAPISTQLETEARKFAETIFTLLDCEGMARVDLFLDRHTERFYFNEINSIPGFTQISMYPKLMTASGVSYSQLLTHLVKLAIARHARKNQLSRDYITNEV